VMLGEALEGLRQTEEARNACENALTIERNYLPTYICLTEISFRHQEWDAVLNLTESVLRLNPAGDGYVYFFQATAYYRMQRFAEAEKSAVEAAGLATEHSSAAIYLLLAQIYEAEGHSDTAAAQIRHFLKLSADREGARLAKQYLATLEGQQATK
jgi:tetratricopeptide (TPR) repeat protein